MEARAYPSPVILLFCTFIMTCWQAQVGGASDSQIHVTSRLTAGGVAELTCTVENLGKRRIIWTKLTEALPLSVGTTRFIPDSRIRVTSLDADSVRLTIRDVRREEAGEYRCRVSGEDRLEKLTTLDIPARDSQSTQLLDTQTEMSAVVGDTVLLPCHVINLNTRLVLWKHQLTGVVSLRKKIFNGDRRYQVVHDRAEQWSLKISNLRASDFGLYTCLVNSRPVLTKTVVLKNSAPVEMAPILKSSSKLKTKVTAEEGNNVTFHCEFKASPPAKVIWYIRGNKGSKSKYTEVGRGNHLTLNPVSPSHAGKYICMGKNGIRPHGRGRTRLTVKALPTVQPYVVTTFIPTGPGEPRVYADLPRHGQIRNENHQLTCHAIGWPRPSIYWRYKHERLTPNYKYHIKEEMVSRFNTRSTLTVRSLSLRDYGHYECIARNHFGRVETKMELFETKPE